MRYFLPSFVVLAFTTLILGFAYPLGIQLFADNFYPTQAKGSLMSRDGRVVGSYLIAYPSYQGDMYFQSRPSNAAISAGVLVGSASNLALTNSELWENATENAVDWKESEKDSAAIPANEMVFASASGLDPNISYESAVAQVPRISIASRIPPESLLAIINAYHASYPLVGADYVNINYLNRAIDQVKKPE